MLKIYLITRNDTVDYDEYDSAVVIAESPEEALEILKQRHGIKEWNGWKRYDVSVTEIELDCKQILLESFNAG